eukprot:1318982-Karenia_brevis.AAC.1
MSALYLMMPKRLHEEMEPQQHLFNKYETLREHVLNIIQNRTSGACSMVMALDAGATNADELHSHGEEGDIFKLEIKNGQRTMVRQNGRTSPTKEVECFKCGYKGHYARDCKSTKHKDGGPLREPRKRVSTKALGVDEDSGEITTTGCLELCAVDGEGHWFDEDPWGQYNQSNPKVQGTHFESSPIPLQDKYQPLATTSYEHLYTQPCGEPIPKIFLTEQDTEALMQLATQMTSGKAEKQGERMSPTSLPRVGRERQQIPQGQAMKCKKAHRRRFGRNARKKVETFADLGGALTKVDGEDEDPEDFKECR